MPDLPTGTVTFLFTDIEGSTRRWEQHREAMGASLARHDALLRAAITAHGGVVFKTVGDAFCAAFAIAPTALAAALAAQFTLAAESWGEPGPLRVRMALHTGQAECRDGDYFGPPLNRVARLLAAGSGGQVLLSGAARELVRESLPPDAALRDLGEHHFKDLSRPDRVFQLLHPDLPDAYPPLRSLDSGPTNLPTQPTPLIGREEEIATAITLLRRDDVRLVTLSGPGGVGKTHLALQVGADLLDAFLDGVWFVALAPLADPTLIGSAVAAVLGVREEGGQPLLARLIEFLRERRLLLVLDNFEHLLAGAPFAAELLRACPRLSILTTSRAVLRLRGEHELTVPTLAVPDPRRLPPLDRLSQYAAVRLFTQRAATARPGFAVTDTSAPALAELCARLDGLPLAIELAAARIRLLSPTALLARLEPRLPLLTGGARDLPTRHQTLRGAIAWSYDLLAPAEQTLFRRLAVCSGGCDLEAATAIAGSPDSDEPDLDVLDGLALLVDHSLVRQHEDAAGECRYQMLETVREYGLEQLAAAGESDDTHRRHAAHILALAERAEQELIGPDQALWLARLDRDYGNLRTALGWTLTADAGELGLRLATALWRFWAARGYLAEGFGWLERAAAASAAATPIMRAKALNNLGNLANDLCDYERAQSLYEQSLAIRQNLGDRRAVASTLNNLGLLATNQGDHARARTLLEENLAIRRELRDQPGVAFALHNLGRLAHREGHYPEARRLHEEALAIRRALGDLGGIAYSSCNLAEVARDMVDDPTASRLFTESLTLFRQVGNKLGTAKVLTSLAGLAQRAGDLPRAVSLYHEALALWREIGDKYRSSECLEGIAALAWNPDDGERAARLFGAAAARREVVGEPVSPAARADQERHLADLRAGLGPDAFEAAWAMGRTMPLERAFDEALAIVEIVENVGSPLTCLATT